MQPSQFIKSIFSIRTEDDFNSCALEVFNYQYLNNSVYKTYCDLLKVSPSSVTTLKEIPFLPIQFFKTYNLISGTQKATHIFESSGTTGSVTSKHYVTNIGIYEESFKKGIKAFYPDINQYTILALLPSYLERKGSSLVYMVNALIEESNSEHSGFYLNNTKDLIQKLLYLEKNSKKCILIGVSYALLDLIEIQKFNLKHTLIMETGGMKGRRKEMIKDELHAILKKGFGVPQIHSEYGMTELLSQAYSQENEYFKCPPWMRVLTRDPEDPFSYVDQKTGGINVIDLANINSCSFIATQDLGKTHPKNGFKILGRFDHSDIRGCNLMVF